MSIAPEYGEPVTVTQIILDKPLSVSCDDRVRLRNDKFEVVDRDNWVKDSTTFKTTSERTHVLNRQEWLKNLKPGDKVWVWCAENGTQTQDVVDRIENGQVYLKELRAWKHVEIEVAFERDRGWQSDDHIFGQYSIHKEPRQE